MMMSYTQGALLSLSRPTTGQAMVGQRNWSLKRIAVSVIGTVVVAGAILAWWALGKGLPQVKGELPVPGLELPVVVVRDDQGVPSIKAETMHDLFLAQGYVTAQDRLFQMELLRRLGSGTLAEVAGKAATESDMFYRALRFRAFAALSYDALDTQTQEALMAYAQGVNAYIDEARSRGKLPLEYNLLGFEPEPWTPIDSLTAGRYLSFSLSSNWEGEAARHALRLLLGDDLALELFPTYPGDDATMHDITTTHEITTLREEAQRHELPPLWVGIHDGVDINALLASLPKRLPGIGSNNWVVSGARTESGYALLANDPHVPVMLPAIWYATHLTVPGELNVSGVTMPGVPGILVGRNDAIAWGVTTTMADLQDLYVERRNPENPYQFEYMGSWEEAEVYHEVIRVKGGTDVPLEVVWTRHGPIISDFVSTYFDSPDAYVGYPMALKWTGHDATLEISAVLQMQRARNWEEFRLAIKEFFPQNFVFASVDGDIAYRMSGRIPIRSRGNGLVPVPGWTGEWEWLGTIPFEEMPELVNPSNGYIATANNQVVGPGYGHLITAEWEENPYRANRIVQFLESTPQLTVQDMFALQNDVVDLHAAKLLPKLLPILRQRKGRAPLEDDAVTLLEIWDFHSASTSGAALLWNRLWWQINRMLYEERLPEATFVYMAERQGNVTDQLLLDAAAGKPSRWVEAVGGLDEVVNRAFDQAVEEIVHLQGTDLRRWQWGAWHRTHFAPAGADSGLLRWFMGVGPYPSGGNGSTVAAHYFNPVEGYVTSTASWRQIVDLSGIEDNVWQVLAPGQSGHVLSRWYRDQAKSWSQGEQFRQSLSWVSRNEKYRLVLVPVQ